MQNNTAINNNVLFGLTGIRRDERKYFMDRKSLILSITFCVITVIGNIYQFYWVLSADRLSSASFTGLVAIILAALVITSFTFTLNKISTYTHLQSVYSLPIINKVYSRSKLNFFNRLLFIILTLNICRGLLTISYLYTEQVNKTGISKTLKVLSYGMQCIHMGLQRSVLAFIMTKVEEKYKILCDRVNHIIQKLDLSNKNAVEENYVEFRRIVIVHSQLRNSALAISTSFSVPILMLLLFNSTNFVLEPTWLVNKIREGNGLENITLLLISNFIGFIVELSWFWFTVQPYQNIMDLDKEFCYLLVDIFSKQIEEGNESKSNEALEIIIQHRTINPLVFCVFETFTIDTSLIGSLISAATTYSILLIQFNDKII